MARGYLSGVLWFGSLVAACSGTVKPLPRVPPPAAGYWFDAVRSARAKLEEPGLIAGAARVKLTPWKLVRIAGHGHLQKRSKGVLDDIYARVLYLDSGSEAVALVSLDFIGFMLPRVERIRARVTQNHAKKILIASTHNHAGPDTIGLWGDPLLGLIPLRCGVDPAYVDWVERRVAWAIRRAVARARPARLVVGRFIAPGWLAKNLREPGDVPREVTVLRAVRHNGSTIGTLVSYANHAEALQDKNKWLSADWPGVLCREVDEALGGVTLFFSAPAGGMIEPNNDPDDPERERLAFRERMGGALARGVILQAINGKEKRVKPALRVTSRRFELPLQPGGTVDLAMKLKLLEHRPRRGNRLITEIALVELGEVRLVTVPGEPTPAVGRMIARMLGAPYPIIITLGMDELAYMITDRQWRDPRFDYERSMSLGPGTTGRVLEAIRQLVRESNTTETRD